LVQKAKREWGNKAENNRRELSSFVFLNLRPESFDVKVRALPLLIPLIFYTVLI